MGERSHGSPCDADSRSGHAQAAHPRGPDRAVVVGERIQARLRHRAECEDKITAAPMF